MCDLGVILQEEIRCLDASHHWRSKGYSNVLHLDGQVPRSSCKEFYDNDE